MNKIEITLSSANMGDVDEVDFILWAQFVTDNIDAALGFEVASVERGQWPCSAGFDTITGANEEQRDAIREWIDVTGWNDFCGDTWEKMRREYDAARADVVSLPEIATLRRGVHAAHARMAEAEKRSDGRGMGDHTYPTNHTGDERKTATAEWNRLTDEYEARVAAEMEK